MSDCFVFKGSLAALGGVGEKRARALAQQGIESVEDLWNYFPVRYLDRSTVKHIARLEEGEQVTVTGVVRRVEQSGGKGRGARFKAWLDDDTGLLEMVWFSKAVYFSRTIRPGHVLAVYGKAGFFNRRPQMHHPDFERLASGDRDSEDHRHILASGKIFPIYSVTEAMKKSGLGSRQLQRIVSDAFRRSGAPSDDMLSPQLLREYRLMGLAEAYRQVHMPASTELLYQAIRRMKWNELFFAQLYFAIRYHDLKTARRAIRFTHSGQKTSALYNMLPFSMTSGQKQAVREIYRDLRSGSPMHRLLQGDVGSGKTLVAMFAMALAADNGLQAAIMAPTEILAFQHWLGIRSYAEPAGLNVGLLSGRQKKSEREAVLGGLSDGTLDIVVGTHAVLEDAVKFHRLGLVIIDEQHRFGVLQRKALQDKSLSPHVLLMTATPIPRTLAMGAFGDLDVTVIKELPGGRKRIVTRLCSEHQRSLAIDAVKSEVRRGRQAYIVYPLVEESENIDLKAAVEWYRHLAADVFPETVLGLVHGRMGGDEKEEVMRRFRQGDIDILVGTTVIEVGVDVPNATVMVIEHAERFGLAQLHQLRGRVGRGEHQSFCFLMYERLAGDSSRRLNAMAECSDGFRLSEIDAEIRGPGNVLGKEQSGLVSGFRLADPVIDYGLMCEAREAAFTLARQDPLLERPEHSRTRTYYHHYYQKGGLAGVG
ncbi:MAG: ATP-dependent DNA helicase RecG [Prosthecochloris sp.]|nr:ATP-dependent DNA helicase RecG [Prosthecochloris sp.]